MADSLKDLLLLRSRRSWSPTELVRRLDAGLFYYAVHKPHQGLAGATPAEVYFALKDARSNAKRPLREYELSRKKKPPDQGCLEIEYLDHEYLLPVLISSKKAA